MVKIYILGIAISIAAVTNVKAQPMEQTALSKTIRAQDSLMFDVGFNTCDIRQFETLLSQDLRFYHDKDGISDRSKFLSDLKNGLCHDPETRQVKRELVDSSVKIYPLYKNGTLYGAVQNGNHLFRERPQSTPGFARFTNVWNLEQGTWKLATSISYDHQPYKENAAGMVPEYDWESHLKGLLKQNHIRTLGLGIIEGGKLTQIKVFGELSDGVTAPYNTIFNVASLAKPVTAMVVMRLASAGKWDLDEPLYRYYIDPDIKSDVRHKKLTTRLVLSHQTGFPNWRWESDTKKLCFLSDPGAQYGYSGEGFEYLRKALERKFGKPLEQLASELIFEPAAMIDTDYVPQQNAGSSRYANGYDENGTLLEMVPNTNANAADDLHTTIADYGNFLVGAMKGSGLSEKIHQQMFTKQVKTRNNKYFGLGFEIYELENGDIAVSHGGSDNGSQCLTFFFPRSGTGILIFTNSTTGYRIFNPLLIHYLGDTGRQLIEIEK